MTFMKLRFILWESQQRLAQHFLYSLASPALPYAVFGYYHYFVWIAT